MSSYEPGMKITYDPISQRVVVAFRGRIVVLPETYENEPSARAAAEAHCRRLGWVPLDKNKRARSLRHPWRD